MKPADRHRWGFWAGCVAGSACAAIALALHHGPLAPDAGGTATWIGRNLGHSVWFFAAVLAAFVVQLTRLETLLTDRSAAREPNARHEIARLDQLLDVWMQVFIGIGVIWTAVGMRSALQAALADPDAALSDSAGNVLRSLVDGGILLALTTTIVGAVGGYLMRLAKTAWVGTSLTHHYAELEREDMQALLAATERIEARLTEPRPTPVTAINGAERVS